MAVEIYIPKLGQTVEEVKIVQWMAEDGAAVKKGQEILEIETDKTTFVVEAEASGTLHRGAYAVGQTVPVLEVVAIIGGKDEEVDKETRRQGDKETPAESAGTFAGPGNAALSPSPPLPISNPAQRGSPGLFASPRARRLAEAKGVALATAAIAPTGGAGVRIVEKDVLAYLACGIEAATAAAAGPGLSACTQRSPKGSMPEICPQRETRPQATGSGPATGGGAATPLARKLAAEAGIDLRTVAGTGPGGKITKEDVEAVISPSPISQSTNLPIYQTTEPAGEVAERTPLKGVRAVIADRMETSVHTTARVTLVTEVDATEFVAMRERLKARVSEEWGFAPGYNDLLAIVVAKALRKYPYMNARLAPDAIELMAHVNLGMAVDTEAGLLVPVIRDADTKSLRQFGAEFRELAERGRKGRSLPDDLAGGTFTITNLGMYDVDAFTPVINLPEAAILGVGRIGPKWVYRPESPDAPVLRQMLTLSLAFDHRLVDGAPAARFLQFIKGLIEEPCLLIAG